MCSHKILIFDVSEQQFSSHYPEMSQAEAMTQKESNQTFVYGTFDVINGVCLRHSSCPAVNIVNSVMTLIDQSQARISGIDQSDDRITDKLQSHGSRVTIKMSD